jgi:hypothetical protein
VYNEIEEDTAIVKESFGYLDENGYYVCPFCKSYARKQKDIKHTPNCFINNIPNLIKEDDDKVKEESLQRTNNILCYLDDIKSAVDGIKDELKQ